MPATLHEEMYTHTHICHAVILNLLWCSVQNTLLKLIITYVMYMIKSFMCPHLVSSIGGKLG